MKGTATALPTVKEARARLRAAQREVKLAREAWNALPIDRERYDQEANRVAGERHREALLWERIAKDTVKHAVKRECAL